MCREGRREKYLILKICDQFAFAHSPLLSPRLIARNKSLSVCDTIIWENFPCCFSTGNPTLAKEKQDTVIEFPRPVADNQVESGRRSLYLKLVVEYKAHIIQEGQEVNQGQKMNPMMHSLHLSSSAIPLKFHSNHSGVEIAKEGNVATWRTRVRGQKKFVFSARPIGRNEKVFVRVMENSILNETSPDNHKKNSAQFGFTTFDPALLSTAAGQVELHSDVKAILVTESLKKSSIYSFWMDGAGLQRGSDCQVQTPVLGLEPLPYDLPLWFVARATGNITLKLVDSDIVYMVAGDMGPGSKPCTIVYPDLQNCFAHIMQVNRSNANSFTPMTTTSTTTTAPDNNSAKENFGLEQIPTESKKKTVE